MQTPRQFAQSLAWMTFNRKPDLNQWENHIRARDAEIRRDAFEAGYAQGHNDTVEGCTRDMRDASNDYIAASRRPRDEM